MSPLTATLDITCQDYSVEHLSPTQIAMLEDLRDYGIVWQRRVRNHLVVLCMISHVTDSLNQNASVQLVSPPRSLHLHPLYPLQVAPEATLKRKVS